MTHCLNHYRKILLPMKDLVMVDSSNELKVINGLIEGCKHLHGKNMLAAADGNVSYRISDDRILITPSGVSKSKITPDQVAVINLAGDVISGNPSSERLMHLTIYQSCPEARVVVHAHPPNAIAWSVAFPESHELPNDILSEVVLAAGRIPIAPYARPSTPAMGEVLTPFLPDCRLMILARHGALSWGESLDEAFNGMERLEHAAYILRLAHSLGQPTKLPAEEMNALLEMRKKIGPKTL